VEDGRPPAIAKQHASPEEQPAALVHCTEMPPSAHDDWQLPTAPLPVCVMQQVRPPVQGVVMHAGTITPPSFPPPLLLPLPLPELLPELLPLLLPVPPSLDEPEFVEPPHATANATAPTTDKPKTGRTFFIE